MKKRFFLILFFFKFLSINILADNIYKYNDDDKGKKIPREYMYFLEKMGPDANYNDLKNQYVDFEEDFDLVLYFFRTELIFFWRSNDRSGAVPT